MIIAKKNRSKSYVGMMACPICGKDSGILLNRILSNTFEEGKKYVGDPCPECQKGLDMGGIC